MKKIILLSIFIVSANSAQSMEQEDCIDLEAGNVNLRGSVELRATDKETVNNELLLAVSTHDVQEVVSAIRRGADVNCQDEQGNTPLLLAYKDIQNPSFIEACFKIIEMLIDEEADETIENKNGESAALLITSLESEGQGQNMQTSRKQGYFPSCWFL